MTPAVHALPDAPALRQFVLDRLCQQDRLDPDAAVLHQVPVVRRGKPCAVQFRVRSYRPIRTSAIWACDEHRLLFYDGRGERCAEVLLSEEPPLDAVLKAEAGSSSSRR